MFRTFLNAAGLDTPVEVSRSAVTGEGGRRGGVSHQRCPARRRISQTLRFWQTGVVTSGAAGCGTVTLRTQRSPNTV